jgi:hypothetical protein
MNRWIAEHRKTLTIAGLGILQLAAYVAADPRNLPSWVVTLAVAVNTIGVYAVRNDLPPRSRRDLVDRVGTRVARPDERPRRPFEIP